MKAYMGFSEVWGQGEAACLVFASTAREAKKLAWPIVHDWWGNEWIDCRATLMLKLPSHLKKLDTGEPQVFDCPPGCPRCEIWGHELYPDTGDGQRCDNCIDDED